MVGTLGMENMGELNFHYDNGSPRTKMRFNPCQYIPGVQEHSTELSFVKFIGCGNWFFKVINQVYPKWRKYITAMSIFIVFVTK